MSEEYSQKKFKVMKIGGKITLFTADRLDREKLPENLYVYECRHADSGDIRTPATIENNVKVNFCGTILSKEPIKLTKSEYGDYREITIFDKVAYKKTMTLEEYIKENKQITKLVKFNVTISAYVVTEIPEDQPLYDSSPIYENVEDYIKSVSYKNLPLFQDINISIGWPKPIENSLYLGPRVPLNKEEEK